MTKSGNSITKAVDSTVVESVESQDDEIKQKKNTSNSRTSRDKRQELPPSKSPAPSQTDDAIDVITESKTVKTDAIYDVVEEMPSFPGGRSALMTWLSNNIKYPDIAVENGIQGRVIVQFIVEKNGSVTDIQVTKSVDPSLDKEAVRLVSIMPKWKPGKTKGSTVRVKYTLPVTFRLE